MVFTVGEYGLICFGAVRVVAIGLWQRRPWALAAIGPSILCVMVAVLMCVLDLLSAIGRRVYERLLMGLAYCLAYLSDACFRLPGQDVVEEVIDLDD